MGKQKISVYRTKMRLTDSSAIVQAQQQWSDILEVLKFKIIDGSKFYTQQNYEK